MLEQTTTRHNELIDPLLHVWGWEIPVYLFLGGLVAGMMILTGYFQLTKSARRMSCVCARLPIVGLILLSLGMFALFLDLEHKLYTWRLYTTFEPTSVMSWGAWILILVYPVLLASVFVRPPELLAAFVPALDRSEAWFEQRPELAHLVAAANIGLGIALGIYTGILLSTLGARPLWSSSLLGPLFLFSGLSAAAAFVHFVTGDPVERRQMEVADTAFLAVELSLVLLFVVGLATSTQAHAQAASLLLGGSYTAVFWVLVVLLGIVVPMVIQFLVVVGRVGHAPIAPLLVLMGGLALRFVVVSAGQASEWTTLAGRW